MFQQKFAEIFAELDSIEIKLKDSHSRAEKDRFSERLLSLRRLMDQCIQSWLCFEERINQLQDHYGLELPDEIPDMLFKNLGLEELDILPDPGKATNPQETLPQKEASQEASLPDTGFSKMRKDASISSFKRGLGFFDLYMLEEAIKEFENLVSLEPNFIFGHFLLGYVYSQKQQHEDAERELRLVLALTDDPQLKGMAYNGLGNIYAERAKFEQALEEFHLAEENFPENHEVAFNLAATYYNLNQYQESIRYFKKAIEHFPDDWEIYFYIGKGYEYLKDYGEAASYLEKAMDLNSADPQLNFELGIVYHLMNKREKAISQYLKTLELTKKNKARQKRAQSTGK
jgi:tetratricopeptide (TPR) repeat protein